MRILVAEDDPVSRILLKTTLQNWGYEPVLCQDGLAALSILETAEPPEMAILDWMMPEMDGTEVCRRIRQKSSAAPVYIILLTAKAQHEDLLFGLRAGADDYVTKPFNRHELYARLQSGIRIITLQRTLAARLQDLELAYSNLRGMQHANKLEALGQMASGIAHEINTPMQFIGDNIRFLQESLVELMPGLARTSDNSDIQYFVREIPKAIDEALQGVQRITTIVRAMRDFSHPAAENTSPVDINHAIETTLTVATSKWKYVADIERDFDPALPHTRCLAGEIHKVLLHLIVNAAQAIADVHKQRGATGGKGLIRISTQVAGDYVEIRISDTGSGIPEEYRARVFDPFFTSKDTGQGSGQGLAIAYSVIVRRHNGRIRFESELGKGTTFFIQLPVDGIGADSNDQQTTNSVQG